MPCAVVMQPLHARNHAQSPRRRWNSGPGTALHNRKPICRMAIHARTHAKPRSSAMAPISVTAPVQSAPLRSLRLLSRQGGRRDRPKLRHSNDRYLMHRQEGVPCCDATAMKRMSSPPSSACGMRPGSRVTVVVGYLRVGWCLCWVCIL